MPKKGYKRSQKFREKLRQVNLGKKHSKQTRSKISNSLKGHWTGKDNPNWKSGKSKYTTNTIAKIRDDYTCQICGLREPEIMEVDHIKPKARFPELKYNLDNERQ